MGYAENDLERDTDHQGHVTSHRHKLRETGPLETSARPAVLVSGFLLVVVAYAGLSRVWTDTSSPWYDALRQPAWQPPDAVFGIVWPLNFLALTVVGVLVSRKRPDVARPALAVFAVSVVFALGWSYLFSEEHALLGSALSLAVAALLTWALVVVVGRAGRAYAAGLLVYAVWMTLATSLSIGYAVLN